MEKPNNILMLFNAPVTLRMHAACMPLCMHAAYDRNIFDQISIFDALHAGVDALHFTSSTPGCRS